MITPGTARLKPRNPPPHRRRRHLPRPRRPHPPRRAPSWPNSTMNGPRCAATSASTSSPGPSPPPNRDNQRR